MFDHVKFGVSDYAASKAFFLKALEPLGVTVVTEWPPNGIELSQPNGNVSLCLHQTEEKPAHLHLAFVTEHRQQVDDFYRAALEAGGKDNGPPGLRPQYSGTYYAAFVIGPDGHNIEAVCHETEAVAPPSNRPMLSQVPHNAFPIEGGCDCQSVRYRLTSAPLIVHCCHCRWCQRESGAAFALNAMIESDRVENLGAEPELVNTPSESGQGQKIARCPACKVAVWSHYAGSGPVTRFIRVGTLDNPDLLPPDAHIFIASKQPWVVLPPGTPAFEAYYEREALWPADSLSRRAKLLPLIEAYQAGLRGAA